MVSKKSQSYTIQLKPSAERYLKKIDKSNQRRIARAIDSLARNPYPTGAHKLRGKEGFLRIRAGDYRIIYLVHKKEIQVVVVSIGHRSNVYRRL